MSYYSDNASALFEQYSQTDPAILHRDWMSYLPSRPGLVCDIGAGTGRDANWLAEKGWDVIAVEPEAAFRRRARQHSHPKVAWLDDKLPELAQLRKLNQRFNLILLSAVWMHLPETRRERAFRILSDLLAPGGVLVISLRHSINSEENRSRNLYDVSVNELEHLARQRALSLKLVAAREDLQGRAHVRWEIVVFELPDDGTGSLPLLRHIIVNDDKSATYKLGLIRTLLRIADGAPGMALRQTDDYVEVPFGLVGLYWIKLYMPLVLNEKLIQSPSHKPDQSRGLGFAKAEHFYQLAKISPYDLRVGATFGPELAPIIIGSIRDACSNIQQMPANFITFPGSDRQVFDCERRSIRYRAGSHWRIDKERLSSFGVFRIPLALWQCLGQYSCWIEPAILNEWANLMNGYNAQYDRSVYDRAFQWEDSKRTTLQVRKIASQVQKNLALQKQFLQCVWTGTQLRDQGFEIDHCSPWSRWFNNDLWNLLPASKKANNRKREKLPSALLMHGARERILAWWESAYNGEELHAQFQIEAESALPLIEGRAASLDEVYDAMLFQRTRLHIDQRLAEWNLCSSARV